MTLTIEQQADLDRALDYAAELLRRTLRQRLGEITPEALENLRVWFHDVVVPGWFIGQPRPPYEVVATLLEDGSGVFGFTPEMVYLEHNLKYMVSSIPLTFAQPVALLAIVETPEAKKALEASKKAME